MKKLYSILFIAVVALTGLVTTSKAHASGTVNLTGWGWSSNIGWISFSSQNAGQSTGGTYNVTLSTTTGSDIGNFGGWAWSSNIGWISFQNGNGAHPNPTVDLITGDVSGWVRACAGTVNHDCTGADRTDGWDGWIHLSDPVGHPTRYSDGSQGVSFDPVTGKFSGYAWGDVNVGWLTFGTQIDLPLVCPNGNCGGGGGGTTITGSCISEPPTPPNLPVGGADVTFTITPSNGTGPYSATGWTASGNTKLTKTFSPISSTNSAFDVTVTDSSNPANSGSINCPKVTVDDSSQPGIKMWIRNLNGLDTGTLTTQKIRVGQNATIKWAAEPGTTLGICKGTLVKEGAGPQTINPLPSDGIYTMIKPVKGLYTYFMSCANGETNVSAHNNNGGNSLQIIVTDSRIEEI
jgi:hypothetical protein